MTTNRTPTPVAGLPLLKRHIASHDANGKSIYTTSPAQQFIAIPGVGGLARSYSVSGVPATLTDDADLKAYLSSDANQVTSWTQPNIVTPNGVNLLIVDLEPGGVSQMHRTVSIDFSVCVMGTILHELDSGETVTLKPGVSLFCEVFKKKKKGIYTCLRNFETNISSSIGPYRPARH